MKTVLRIFFNYKITPARVALLGMLTALLIALKYALGFVPGLEMISFMMIIFGLILPWYDLFLLIVVFNLTIPIIYGFGTWWLAYWIIFPIDALGAKYLSKVTRNCYVLSIWGFLGGFLVFFWYFLSDLIFFDATYATLNIISALPINLIEGLATMLCVIIIGPLMINAIKHAYPHFYQRSIPFTFKTIKNGNITLYLMPIIILLTCGAIITLFMFNDVFLHWKELLIGQNIHRGLLPT